MTAITPPVAPPLTPLWPHQVRALHFVQRHWAAGHKGINLSLIMGSGKSRVAIEAAAQGLLSPVLILCPRRVVEVWRGQFEAHRGAQYDFLALDDRVGSVAEKAHLARERMAWCHARKRPLAIAINFESSRLEPFAHWALANYWPLVIAD